jgi:CubicO group peptidase (beta-lactamase class C family)
MWMPADSSRLLRTHAAINTGTQSGLHIGAQLFAMIDGRTVADFAVGQCRLDPQTPMATDTLMLWLSGGKPLTAAAIGMLKDQGRLDFDDPVAKHVPEFAANGKDQITLRHLLTHTAGIRGLDAQYPFQTWDETLEKICAGKIERDWIPGQKAGYHTHTSWYVLGEIINRLTATPHDQWIRHNLLEPLNMTDTWLAMSPEQYESYGPRIGVLYDTTKTPPRPLPNLDTQLASTRPRPSASARGPIRQLANFYEMLRNGGQFNNAQILHPQTVHSLTSRQRIGMFDHTFRQTIDWGLGFIINSSHHGPAGGGIPYQYGPHASPGTFGHGGSQSSTAFCDPDNKLVVALLFNGCPGEPAHDKRLRATLKALYEDLHLAIAAPQVNRT